MYFHYKSDKDSMDVRPIKVVGNHNSEYTDYILCTVGELSKWLSQFNYDLVVKIKPGYDPDNDTDDSQLEIVDIQPLTKEAEELHIKAKEAEKEAKQLAKQTKDEILRTIGQKLTNEELTELNKIYPFSFYLKK